MERTVGFSTLARMRFIADRNWSLIFAGNETLRAHMYKEHEVSRMFMCRCCNWAFPDKTSLHVHIQVEKRERKEVRKEWFQSKEEAKRSSLHSIPSLSNGLPSAFVPLQSSLNSSPLPGIILLYLIQSIILLLQYFPFLSLLLQFSINRIFFLVFKIDFFSILFLLFLVHFPFLSFHHPLFSLPMKVIIHEGMWLNNRSFR